MSRSRQGKLRCVVHVDNLRFQWTDCNTVLGYQRRLKKLKLKDRAHYHITVLNVSRPFSDEPTVMHWPFEGNTAVPLDFYAVRS